MGDECLVRRRPIAAVQRVAVSCGACSTATQFTFTRCPAWQSETRTRLSHLQSRFKAACHVRIALSRASRSRRSNLWSSSYDATIASTDLLTGTATAFDRAARGAGCAILARAGRVVGSLISRTKDLEVPVLSMISVRPPCTDTHQDCPLHPCLAPRHLLGMPNPRWRLIFVRMRVLVATYVCVRMRTCSYTCASVRSCACFGRAGGAGRVGRWAMGRCRRG